MTDTNFDRLNPATQPLYQRNFFPYLWQRLGRIVDQKKHDVAEPHHSLANLLEQRRHIKEDEMKALPEQRHNTWQVDGEFLPVLSFAHSRRTKHQEATGMPAPGLL